MIAGYYRFTGSAFTGCNEIADALGVPSAKIVWFSDAGTETANLQRLLADVGNGVVDAVGIYSLDSIGTSFKEVADACQKLVARKTKLVIAKQSVSIDSHTSDLFISILGSVEDLAVSIRKRRQQAGIEAAKRRGVFKGRRKGAVKSNPDRVRELKESGMTNSQIANLVGIGPRTVTRYLSKQS